MYQEVPDMSTTVGVMHLGHLKVFRLHVHHVFKVCKNDSVSGNRGIMGCPLGI